MWQRRWCRCSGCRCSDERPLRAPAAWTSVGFIPWKRSVAAPVTNAGARARQPETGSITSCFCFFFFYIQRVAVGNYKQQTQEVTSGAHHSPLSSLCFFLFLLNWKHSWSLFFFSSRNLSTFELFIYFFTFCGSFQKKSTPNPKNTTNIYEVFHSCHSFSFKSKNDFC